MHNKLLGFFTVALISVTFAFLVGCSRQLNEEQKKEIAALKQETARLDKDIAEAEAMAKQFPGGVVGGIVNARLELLRTNKALFEQRAAAIEFGAEIKQVVQATNPDPVIAQSLEGDIASLEKEIASFRVEAMSAGGLIGSMKQANLATKEFSLAQLKLQFLKAKYGLAMPSVGDKGGEGVEHTKAVEKPKVEPNKTALPASDGPFGLAMGTKLEAFGDDLTELAPGVYKLHQVPTPNQFFSEYIARIGPTSGLCWLKGLAPKRQVNSYGSELRRSVDEIAEMLTERYGPGKKRDMLLPGSIWKEPNYWMMGLSKGERFYGKVWENTQKSGLGNDLKTVFVGASADSSESGRVSIEYAFANEDPCENELKRMGAKGL